MRLEIILIAIAILFIVFISGCISSVKTCVADSDCVPASCCHPTACVAASEAPDCSAISCTAECAQGTMDCGCGACACIDGKCQVEWSKDAGCSAGINNFDECVAAGYPVMESYPRQCSTPDGVTFVEEICNDMSLEEAREIAVASECGDRLKATSTCNAGTNTWWIDLDIEQEGCNPACVVNIVTREAEINWRCTGLIPE